MRPKHRGLWRLLALLLTLTLVAAACGDDDDGGDDAADGGGDEVSGEVNVTGSSTVEPISTAVAELFQEQNGDVTVNVDGPGTGDGFEIFCNGEADINDASRPSRDRRRLRRCRHRSTSSCRSPSTASPC